MDGDEYDLAISFAAEDGDYPRGLCAEFAALGLRVFHYADKVAE